MGFFLGWRGVNSTTIPDIFYFFFKSKKSNHVNFSLLLNNDIKISTLKQCNRYFTIWNIMHIIRIRTNVGK